MARCVLERPGASPSSDPNLSPNQDADVESDGPTAAFIVGEWIRGMLDLSPVTRGYGAAVGACNVVGFGSYVTAEALYPPHTASMSPDVHMSGVFDDVMGSMDQSGDGAEEWW